MYSWEIREFLKERNYEIGGDDLLELISIKENPQLKIIRFLPYNNSYYMKDDVGEEFFFQAIPYDKAVERGLVKSKKLNKKMNL